MTSTLIYPTTTPPTLPTPQPGSGSQRIPPIQSASALDEGIEFLGDSEGAAEVFPNLLSLYEQQGYRHGYRRAVQELLAALVPAAEDFIHQHETSPHADSISSAELRRLIYRFGQQLEHRLQRTTSPSGSYVSDGLGI